MDPTCESEVGGEVVLDLLRLFLLEALDEFQLLRC